MADVILVLGKVNEVLLFLISLFYLYQILYLVFPLILKKKKHNPQKDNRYAILIAARNEEAVLPHLIDSIRAQNYPSELIDIFVVADNCTDNTADTAREHGAFVFERFDTKHIGKGFALNFLIEHIRSLGKLGDYDCFLVFDADNLLEQNYIRNMNQLPCDGFEAFCGYRNIKNFDTNWITYGYTLWFLHESTHMNRSRYLIGSSANVNGTGFGFTQSLLQKMGTWNFFTLSEDTEFNNWCIDQGVKIGYCQDAILYDEQPVTFSQSWKQRTRWAQGTAEVTLLYTKRLFRNLFRGGWVSYASFEFLTLSLWGMIFCSVSFFVNLIDIYLYASLQAVGSVALSSLFYSVITLIVYGLITVLTDWKHIPSNSAVHKLMAALFYPVFMLTLVPIAALAVFQKRRWVPISHTVAITAEDLSVK